MNKIVKTLLFQKEDKLKNNLYHNTQIMFAYNSNRIEGSSLSEEETKYIFEHNSNLNKDNMNDVIETINHFNLFDYILNHFNDKLDESSIKKIHLLLKQNTLDTNIGEYKTTENEVGDHDTALPINVKPEIIKLLDWYNNLTEITVEEIIDFHYKFEMIHPFQDGNGRVGRIIMFKECLKNNIIPFIIENDHKLFYYNGLKQYKHDKQYLIDSCLYSQDQYQKLLNKYLN